MTCRKKILAILFVLTTSVAISDIKPVEGELLHSYKPKPNIMLLLDASNTGENLQHIRSMTSEEKELFSGYGSISTKKEAIIAVYRKILDDYGPFAHFGLSVVRPISPYAYTGSPDYRKINDLGIEEKDFIELEANNNIHTILYPIREATESVNRTGDYQYYTQADREYHKKISDVLKSFNASTDSSISDKKAWAYAFSEVFKYFWGSTYYGDERLTDKMTSVGIVDKILAKTDNLQGTDRIQYRTYPDPIKYVCQQSHIFYITPTLSRRLDDNQSDVAANIPFGVTQLPESGGFNKIKYENANSLSWYAQNYFTTNVGPLPSVSHGNPLQHAAIGNQLIRYSSPVNMRRFTHSTFLATGLTAFFYGFVEKYNTSTPKNLERYGAKRARVNAKDLAGNLWQHWNYSSDRSDGALIDEQRPEKEINGYSGYFNPADISISSYYFGEANNLILQTSVKASTYGRVSYQTEPDWRSFEKENPSGKLDDLTWFTLEYGRLQVDTNKMKSTYRPLNSTLKKSEHIKTNNSGYRNSRYRSWNSDFGTYSSSFGYSMLDGYNLNTYNHIAEIGSADVSISELYEAVKKDIHMKVFGEYTNGRFFSDQFVEEMATPSMTTFGIATTHYLWTGKIEAYNPIASNLHSVMSAPSKSSGVIDFNEDPITSVGSGTIPSWTTDQTIKYNQGEFFSIEPLTGAKKLLPGGYSGWLKGDLTLNPNQFRFRDQRLGAITNSTVRYAAKDHFYTNLGVVGNRQKYSDYMFIKNENFEQNLIIAGSNDGLLNFIVAHRNSYNKSGKDQKGERKASFFVPFFEDVLNEITAPLYNTTGRYERRFTHKVRVDGKINLFDGFVDSGKTFKTLGISGMGGGYKGLVGFQLFESDGENHSSEISPLFAISNDSPHFQQLGYTASEFAYFNSSDGEAIAVFGNGPDGAGNSSIIYFINANTGEYIGEIKLDNNGLGATSPTLVLNKEGENQGLESIYIGDFKGSLYKVEFESNWQSSLEAESYAVKQLYSTNKSHPIVEKPLLMEHPETKKTWIIFGTGSLQFDFPNKVGANQVVIAMEEPEIMLHISDVSKSSVGNFAITNSTGMKSSWSANCNRSARQGYDSGSILTTAWLGAGDYYLTGTDEFSIISCGFKNSTGSISKSWGVNLSMMTQWAAYSGMASTPVRDKIFSSNSAIFSYIIQSQLSGPIIRLAGRDKIFFKTTSILPGIAGNMCTEDIGFDNVVVVNPFTLEADGVAFYGVDTNSYSNSTRPIVSYNFSNSYRIGDVNTFGEFLTDNIYGNTDSGMNLGLKPAERKRLDDLEGDALKRNQKRYEEELKVYMKMISGLGTVKVPTHTPYAGTNIMKLKDVVVEYPKDSFASVFNKAIFSDSSNIGGRHKPIYQEKIGSGYPDKIDYSVYSFGGTILLDQYKKLKDDGYVGLYLPVSGKFGQGGSFYGYPNFHIQLAPSEPKKPKLKSKRLSIRKIF